MRILITNCILFLLVLGAYGQVKFGLKAGLNLSGASESYSISIPSRDLSLKPGFQAGSWVTIPLADKIAISPELMFAQEGFDWNEGFDRTIHLYYLNLNLPVTYQLVEKLSIEIGPQIGKILNANYRVNGLGNDYDNNYIDGLDLALFLGTKLTLSSQVDLGLRYIYGLSDISEESLILNTNQNDPQLIDINQNKFGLQLSVFVGL